jgi:selenium-binding protein 1
MNCIIFGWNACPLRFALSAPSAFGTPLSDCAWSAIVADAHLDSKPDPTKQEIVKTIEPNEVFEPTGYSRPHTVQKEFISAHWVLPMVAV